MGVPLDVSQVGLPLRYCWMSELLAIRMREVLIGVRRRRLLNSSHRSASGFGGGGVGGVSVIARFSCVNDCVERVTESAEVCLSCLCLSFISGAR